MGNFFTIFLDVPQR